MTVQSQQQAAFVPVNGPGLKSQCLSYVEVLAQSVSVIAPSTVPAAVLGLIFASAGNGTWLSFLFGMVGLVLVSLNINQFARRSASAGSLYSYIVKGLGPTAGVLGGWALLFGYMLTGMSTLCGFVVTAKGLLDAVGLSIPSVILSGAATVAAIYLASRDVQLSARAMLAFEGAAIAAVLALGIVVWRHHGFALDHQQLTLQGATPGGVLMGVVLVVFAFSGFESSTSLGEEAKDPLRTIPKSVIQSVMVSGAVFIFMAYVVILGFRDLPEDLAKTESPLFLLSGKLGVGWLGAFINVGILLSFFSCTLASISATSRIIFSMARHGVAPRVLGSIHPRNETPHVAVAFAALLTFFVALAPSLFGVSEFDSQGYFGTLCSFGFLSVYVLISLAAPAYLRKIGELTTGAIVVALVAAGFMIIPFLGVIGVSGSDLFPPPAYPNNILVWVYLAFMALGAAWLFSLRKSKPEAIDEVFEGKDAPH
ncbi:APC family permease [Rhodoblastus sp.]|uniref:APC family permease n=1 Tax=Rhodoblastus sp. TaxID=1962975 RepID=UPI0025D99513|nr:APC family permease [Rhodoblastus sp.]